MTQTLEQFGQTIKQKYPQYQDIPDVELGQKMLQKYPQYKDLVSSVDKVPEKREKVDTFLQGQGVLKGISDVVGTTGLGKGIAQGIFLKFTPEGKDLLKQVSEGKLTQEEVENIIGKTTTTKEILGSAVQTAATVGTVGLGAAKGASGLSRIGQTGAKIGGLSALSGGAEAFSRGEDLEGIAKEAGMSGAIGFGLGAAGQSLAELGSLLRSPQVTEGIYNRVLGIPKKIVEKGKSPSKMLLREGVVGSKSNILGKSQEIAKNSEIEIAKLVRDNPQRFKSVDVINSIKNELSKRFGNSLTTQEVQSIVDKLPLNPLKTNQYLSTRQLNALRSTIDNQFLGSGKWLSENTSEKISGLKAAANILRNMVQSTDEKLPGIFSNYSNAITAVKSLKSELAKPHVMTNLLELLASGAIGLGTGGFTPEGAAKSAAAFAAFKGVTSAPVATRLAKGLTKLGQGAASQAIKTTAKTLAPGISKEIVRPKQ